MKSNSELFNFGSAPLSERVQRVYTPKPIIQRLGMLWPQGIACDPCSGPDSIVGAERECWPENKRDPDGLAFDWPPRTYANPEFADLVPWMAKFRNCAEAVLLCPTRTHRKWARACMREVDAFCDLDPLVFLGHSNVFPAPLRLHYRGETPRVFSDLFADLGDSHVGPLYARRSQLWLSVDSEGS